MTTELELRFTPEGENTTLELEHSTPAAILDEMVAAYGPGGTIGVAVGWDLTLHMLGKHLSGEAFDPVTWESTDEPRSTQRAHLRHGVRLFRRRGERAMKTSLPQSPSPTHISRQTKSSLRSPGPPPSGG